MVHIKHTSFEVHLHPSGQNIVWQCDFISTPPELHCHLLLLLTHEEKDDRHHCLFLKKWEVEQRVEQLKKQLIALCVGNRYNTSVVNMVASLGESLWSHVVLLLHCGAKCPDLSDSLTAAGLRDSGRVLLSQLWLAALIQLWKNHFKPQYLRKGGREWGGGGGIRGYADHENAHFTQCILAGRF